MKALFTSRNLIGDGLEISAALRAWYKDHKDWEIHLLTHDDHVAEIYWHMGVQLQVCFQPLARHYDFEFDFDISKAFEICDEKKVMMAQGYAELLGVTLGPNQDDVGPFFDPLYMPEDANWIDSVPDDVILFAPFSRSCTSHDGKPPNKCLPWVKWKPIIRYLRSFEKPIRITGGQDDRADQLGFSEEEYLCGFPIRPLAKVMKQKTWLLVSVDNGLSHLAGSQKIPHILFYPLCLGLHYAVPWGNPNVVPIHMDPALAEPAQLLWSLKQGVLMLEDMRAQKKEG